MNLLIIRTDHEHFKQFLNFQDRHIQQIKKINPTLNITIIDGIKVEIDKHLPTTDILIFAPSSDPYLVDFSKAKQLKWAHVTNAGTDDIAFILKDTPILLTNSSGVHPIPIAEHVFAFMIMLARNMNIAHREQIINKKWNQDFYTVHTLSELYQRTIGIIGLGRIGKRIAQVAKGFDMKVITLKHNNMIQNKNVNQSFSFNELDMLLKSSDFVVNCLPLTKETNKYFNLEKFKLMKSSGYFINIGRGKTVVEKDLITALKQRIIAGAGIDVVEDEPLSQNSELWNLNNVIITPHYAGWTPKYVDRVIDIFCENLKAFLENSQMPNLIDKLQSYK